MPRQEKETTGDKLWIAIGDIHDEMDNFEKIPELNHADGIIIAGDLTNNGGVKQAERVIEKARKLNIPIYAQIGNMDRPEVNVWLESQGVNIHCKTEELAPQIAIMGVGGSTYTPFSTPSEFSEETYSVWLEGAARKALSWPHRVLVSHNPPKNTNCDMINTSTHVGSTAVREFIEEFQPDVCICGHIHEGKGLDRLGRTLLVNPGTLADGGYAILRSNDGILSVELAQAEI